MSFQDIIVNNYKRLSIGVCFDDIIFPVDSENKPNKKLFIQELNKICNVKRVRKNQKIARGLQKQYDEANLDINFYSPDNKSRVAFYTLDNHKFLNRYFN